MPLGTCVRYSLHFRILSAEVLQPIEVVNAVASESLLSKKSTLHFFRPCLELRYVHMRMPMMMMMMMMMMMIYLLMIMGMMMIDLFIDDHDDGHQSNFIKFYQFIDLFSNQYEQASIEPPPYFS